MAEKPSVEHTDEVHPNDAGYVAELDEVGLDYFCSRYFLGTFLASGLSVTGGLCAFGLIAPILHVINEDLGPSASNVWVSYVYNAALAVCFAVVGRLSDLFGRRYFFVGGSLLALLGNIVCATATRIDVLIGGNVLMGVASSAQISYCYVLGELVPVKYRYLATSALYLFALPSVFGPAISYSFLELNPQHGWRYAYYLQIGINAVSTVLWLVFYFPPRFHMKHGQDSRRLWIKRFDYVGTILFAGGLVVFLFGISCGGTVYAWKSAPTITMIILGFVAMVAFVIWEIYGSPKEPLVPLQLFKRLDWVATIVAVGFAASIYYAAAVIWPQQVNSLYGITSLRNVGFLSSLPGVGQMAGEVVGGILAVPLGYHRYQLVILFAIGGIFLGCCATLDIDSRAMPAALITLTNFCLGWVEMIGMANSTILIEDQSEIGIAGGMGGSVRSAISAVASVIYVTILSNRLGDTIPERVPEALTGAGLPSSSVADFIAYLTAGNSAALSSLEGVTPSILEAGRRAYQLACVDSYRTVYLSTIAFSAVAVVVAAFTPNTEKLMTNRIAATLHRAGKDNEPKASEQIASPPATAQENEVGAYNAVNGPLDYIGKAAPALHL
ncbi:fungal trichothecene efflux pump [Aspergillus spectabilis]